MEQTTRLYFKVDKIIEIVKALSFMEFKKGPKFP